MNKSQGLAAAAVIIGGAIAFSWFNRVRAVGNMLFLPGSVQSFGFIGSLPTMQFTIFVQNTSGTPVTLNSFAANVFANNQLIGNLSQFQPILIDANQQTVVTVTATLRPVTFVSELIQLFTNKIYRQNIDIEGFANANGLQFPVKLKLSVGA